METFAKTLQAFPQVRKLAPRRGAPAATAPCRQRHDESHDERDDERQVLYGGGISPERFS